MTAPAPSRRRRLAETRLYVISTLGPDDSADRELLALCQAADGGARLFQLRQKGVDTAARRDWLARCRDALPDDVLLVVNDDLEAVLADEGVAAGDLAPLADGVHLGRGDAAALAGDPGGGSRPGSGLAARTLQGLTLARARLGPEHLLGTSTRSLVELDAALAAGADHAGFGAMAPSRTKSDTEPADPAELALCLAAHPDLPLFAIGGLGPDNLDGILGVGCRRAAVGAAILRADDPAAAAAACLAALTGHPSPP